VALVGLLCAPLAAEAGSLQVAWNPSPGPVGGYIVYWGTAPGTYTGSADVGNQTTYVIDGLTAGVTYYVVVRAYSLARVLSVPSNEASGLVGDGLFIDNPLSAGVDSIRAAHIAELRIRINALRAANGLTAALWTDAILVAGTTTVKAVHFSELRSALNAVYVKVGRTPPAFTDPALGGSVPIKAVHVMELRSAILALE
jgi:hypothetical protein